MVFGCVMVFITSGFEHVVANMTTFSLGLYGGLPGADLVEMARNIALVGLGNLIGGALLVGAAYAYRSRPRRRTQRRAPGVHRRQSDVLGRSPVQDELARRAAQRPGAAGNTVTRNSGVTRRRPTLADQAAFEEHA